MPLNMYGYDIVSGFFSTIPLKVQSDNSPYIKHETNWDTALSDPSVVNTSATGIFRFGITDYSKHAFDLSSNPPSIDTYEYDFDWFIDDVDMVDDIVVVGIKDWTSTEKYSSGIYYPAIISNDIISNVDISTYTSPEASTETYTLYNYEISIDTKTGNTGSGYLIVTTINCDGSTKVTPYFVPDGMTFIIPTEPSKNIPTYILNGNFSSDPVDAIEQDGLGFSCTVQKGGCGVNGYYLGEYELVEQNQGPDKKYYICYTNNFTKYNIASDTFTYLNIRGLNNIFQNPKYLTSRPADNNGQLGSTVLNSNTPMGAYPTYTSEQPDYSDIFIEVNFLDGVLSDSIIIPDGSDGKRIYTFGGFLKQSEYFEKCKTLSLSNVGNANAPKTLSNDAVEGYKWYIVYRETSGDYDFITLSSYVVPNTIYNSTQLNTMYKAIPLKDSRFTKMRNRPIENGSALNPVTNGTVLIQNSAISTDAIKVIKVANYAACGKVDIYSKNCGTIANISNNTITSSGHALKNGDSIKFSSALSTDLQNPTNLNNIKYVSGVTTDTFNIYYDNAFQSPVNVTGLKTISGVFWTSSSSNNWKYLHSLYSPVGKNGYGFTKKLRTAVEIATDAPNILDRAVETSILDDGIQKPQSYYNGWISWNNFYPFERSPVSKTLYNGNKFGANTRISKLNSNEYILMVTEPGAQDSFKLFDDYVISSQVQFPQVSESKYPSNHAVIPNYMPNGRIHFYKITKSPYSIIYLKTVAATDVAPHGWKLYEDINIAYKNVAGNYSYNNYPIKYQDVQSTYSDPVNDYWRGARYLCWQKPYIYNASFDIDIPNLTTQESNNEFPFADEFGKCAAFEIENNIIYCTSSTSVKSANFTTGSRIKNIDMIAKTFSYNLSTNIVSFNNDIIVQSTPITNIYDKNRQILEKPNFGFNIDIDNKHLFIAWPAVSREEDAIYGYTRSGINYSPLQTITSPGANGFGDYFVAHNGFLLTDRYSTIDDSGNLTDDLNYIYVYQKDLLGGKYAYIHRISPTIDLSNNIYSSYNRSQYIPTFNTSYDNTSDNSATLTDSLYGKYDLYNNSLIIRDSKEYIYFVFDRNKKKFTPRTHSFARSDMNPVNDAIIRMNTSTASLINGTSNQYIESLQVFEASEILTNIEITTKAYPNPQFLPLLLKSIEGVVEQSGQILRVQGSGPFPLSPTGLNLFMQGPFASGSGITLFTSGPIASGSGITAFISAPNPASGNLNLFFKVYDTNSGKIDLFLKQIDVLGSSGTTLHIHDYNVSESLPLFMGSREKNAFNLYLKTYEYLGGGGYTDEIGVLDFNSLNPGITTLYIENHYTGVPNISGNYNLYLKTHEYSDHGRPFNLVLNPPMYTEESGLPLYLSNPSGAEKSSMQLYYQGPEFLNGSYIGNSTNLIIKQTIQAEIPLFVYNTYVGTGLNLYTRSAYIDSSGINLISSGIGIVSSGLSHHIFGTLGQ